MGLFAAFEPLLEKYPLLKMSTRAAGIGSGGFGFLSGVADLQNPDITAANKTIALAGIVADAAGLLSMVAPPPAKVFFIGLSVAASGLKVHLQSNPEAQQRINEFFASPQQDTGAPPSTPFADAVEEMVPGWEDYEAAASPTPLPSIGETYDQVLGLAEAAQASSPSTALIDELLAGLRSDPPPAETRTGTGTTLTLGQTLYRLNDDCSSAVIDPTALAGCSSRPQVRATPRATSPSAATLWWGPACRRSLGPAAPSPSLPRPAS